MTRRGAWSSRDAWIDLSKSARRPLLLLLIAPWATFAFVELDRFLPVRLHVVRVGSIGPLQTTPAPAPPQDKPDDQALLAKYQEAQAKHLAGEIEVARTMMREVLDAEPKHFELALSIARWLARERNDYPGAVPFARRAFELEPRSVEAASLLGASLIFAGQYADAEQVYRVAVERFPADASMRHGLGIACGKQKKYLDAKAEYARAIDLDPTTGLYHFTAGENLANLGEYDAAEREFRLAVKLKGHADATWKLGEVLAKEGKDAEAEQVLLSGLNDGPKLSRWNAGVQLGAFYFERGRAGDAAAVLHKATQVRPDGRDAWMWLARAQRALGKTDAAARSLKRYQELRTKEDAEEEERLLGLIKAQLEGGKKPAGADDEPKEAVPSKQEHDEPSQARGAARAGD
jgi:tetratricopeptide (TPR) repeat protein